jgi:hypothetical protein
MQPAEVRESRRRGEGGTGREEERRAVSAEE